jgi:2-phosphosulfolactate phosphatase
MRIDPWPCSTAPSRPPAQELPLVAANPPIPLDVALTRSAAGVVPGRVVIVIDQIRASTTITTALDLGCDELLLAGDVETARLLGRSNGRLLAGEQHAIRPDGFDFDNSPSELSRADIRGRRLVLCTTNGTFVVNGLRAADHLLIGCLRNARAVAAAALRLAGEAGDIQAVCCGTEGTFVLDDAVAAGVIVGRIAELAAATGREVALTDAARAALMVRRSFPSLLAAMTDSDGGRTLARIGAPDDIAFCAQEDASETVPVLVRGDELRIELLR